MNTTIAKRRQLHQYIDNADAKKIENLFSYVEKERHTTISEVYNKWDDPGFVNNLKRRTKALEDGTDKGYTWEEVKERARKSVYFVQ